MWYADASFLVSAFGKDSNSNQARAWLRDSPALPILVTRLTLLEFDTALIAAVKMGSISDHDWQAAKLRLSQALAGGYVKRRELSPHQWFPQAHRITAHASAVSLCRALDVLHVAAAILLHTPGFLSFDRQQRDLAESEGLLVKP